MCDCITEIEKTALDDMQEKKRYKKPVAAVRMEGVVFPITGDKMTTRTCNVLEVELEGQKKRQEVSMFHTYCPFCGQKYDAA